jgi:hypothetical protein
MEVDDIPSSAIEVVDQIDRSSGEEGGMAQRSPSDRADEDTLEADRICQRYKKSFTQQLGSSVLEWIELRRIFGCGASKLPCQPKLPDRRSGSFRDVLMRLLPEFSQWS